MSWYDDCLERLFYSTTERGSACMRLLRCRSNQKSAGRTECLKGGTKRCVDVTITKQTRDLREANQLGVPVIKRLVYHLTYP